MALVNTTITLTLKNIPTASAAAATSMAYQHATTTGKLGDILHAREQLVTTKHITKTGNMTVTIQPQQEDLFLN